MTPVTHATDHPPVQGGRSAALAAACVRGGVAAGLGFGALAVLVIAAWISSPFLDNGAGGALHVAAGLWLLAHGVELVRTDTLYDLPAPLGVVPLLLTLLPAGLVHRAARDALDPGGARDRPRPSPSGALASVAGGYLLVAAVIVVFSESGPLPADLITAGLWMPAVVVGAAGTGVWTALGRPLPGQRRATALRAAGLGLVTLLGGGALAVAVSLVWHAGRAQTVFLGLAGEWSGRTSVALLVLALLPNAAVWGAAYGLGPGLTLGTGALATPLGLVGDPAVPPFPLLAALPAEGRGTWPHWATAAVPLAAAVVLGRRAGRAARARSARDAVLTVLGAAGAYGAAVAVLAGAAGGPLGTGRLSAFGPVWWQASAAALLWGACAGIPVALAVRAWGRRSPRPERVPAGAVPAPEEPGDAHSGGGSVRKRDRLRIRRWRRDGHPGRDRRAGTPPGSRPGPRARFRLGVPSFFGTKTGAKPGADAQGLGGNPYDDPYGGLFADPLDGPFEDPFKDVGYEPYDYLPAAWEPATKPNPEPVPKPEPASNPEVPGAPDTGPATP